MFFHSVLPPSSKKRKILLGMLAFNVLFWVWFWFLLWSKLEPRHLPLSDEPSQTYIFGNHALSATNIYNALPFRVMAVVQLPAMVTAKVALRLILGKHYADTVIGGISVAGYQLLLATLFSFFQWYLIGLVFQNLWRRWSGSSSPSPSQSSSTPTTR